tara:strand:- start:23 stop:832 length:810 start_codon:yes stop_codon:yes gene_type:complete
MKLLAAMATLLLGCISALYLDAEAQSFNPPGQDTYNFFCASCHGYDGLGGGWAANFVEDTERMSKSDEELLKSIHEGRGNMPAWEGTLTEEQIREVLQYIRTTFNGQPTFFNVPFINPEPISQGKWEFAPRILVCDTAPVSEQRVRRAVKFWEDLGYEFGPIKFNDTSVHCFQNVFSYGYIIIDLVGSRHRSKAVATTTGWFEPITREIYKMKIVIESGWADSERVLEHELGHALGWRDYNQTGHIMNHNWSRGGMNAEGVEHIDETSP